MKILFQVGSSALLLALVATLAGPAGAADWVGFRGDGSGVSPEVGLPVKWDKDSGLRYKVALSGRGLSNPVIAGGRIFVTACSGYRESELHVLCFDEATGKKLWQRTQKATGNTACHPTTNMAAPTPTTDGKAVYALFATGDLTALDRDGNLLWYRSLVGDYPKITNQVGMAASPVLAGRVLLVPMENAGDSFVAGLDTATGKNLWRKGRSKVITWVTPLTVRRGKQRTAVFSMPGSLIGVEPETGQLRWSLDESGLGTIPSPSYAGGVLYIPGDGGLQAVELPSAAGKPRRLWSSPGFSDGFASPVCHGGRVYGLGKVALKCLGTADGEEVWRLRVNGPFSASPVIAGGRLYAVNDRGRTYVIELGDKPRLLAKNDLGDTILATPAVANGCIYLRSDKYLYCVGRPGKAAR